MTHNDQHDFRTFLVEQTPSTMELAKTLARNAAHPERILAAAARVQTQGRGRNGSTWRQGALADLGSAQGCDASAPVDARHPTTSVPPTPFPASDPTPTEIAEFDSLADALAQGDDFLPVTFAFPGGRVKIAPEWLSIAVGCAVLDAVFSTARFVQTTYALLTFRREALEERLFLKWPNDLVYQDAQGEFRKLCGILCESSVKGNTFGHFYVGLGLNFFSAPDLPAAASLWQWLVDTETSRRNEKSEILRFLSDRLARRVVLTRFANALETELKEYLCVYRSVGQLKSLALARMLPQGTLLSVNKGQHAGRFAGLTDAGGLMLEGVRDPILAADVSAVGAQASEGTGAAKLKKALAAVPAIPSGGPSQPGLNVGLGASSVHGSGNPSSGGAGFGQSSPAPASSPGQSHAAEAPPRPCVLAFDFGNTRIHFGYARNEDFLVAGDLAYADLLETTDDKALRTHLRPLLEHLRSDARARITCPFVSVADARRTLDALSALERFLIKLFPEMKCVRREVSSQELLTAAGLANQYAPEQMGPDRALRFLFAAREAERTRAPVAVMSFGTAQTCECVSPDGRILESIIAPGLQMGLDALHAMTARLPKVGLSDAPGGDTPEVWNTVASMERGVLMSCAGLVLGLVRSHGIGTFVLTGGNARALHAFMSDADMLDVPCRFGVDDRLETRTLCAYLTRAPPAPDTPPDGGGRLPTGGLPESVVRSMLKARLVKRGAERVPTRREDFRRLGGRLENVGVGERIDKLLGDQFRFHTRDVWRERILAGEVRVEHNAPRMPEERRDDAAIHEIKHTYKLKPFDQIWLFHPPEYEPDVLASCDVVFDDGDTVVFSKPGNLVIHAAGLYGKNTFISLARKMGYGDAAPVHRIDRETSGILVCARSASTRKALSAAFREGEIRKMYVAMTRGARALPDAFQVALPIGEPVGSKIRLKLWINHATGLPSLTHFVKLASSGDATLLACLPQTGRTNQIRVHLAAIGHWIVGDKMYHPDEDVFIDFYENGLTPRVSDAVHFPRHLLHNTGIAGPDSLGGGIGAAPVVCPFTPDMMEYAPFTALLDAADLPRDFEGQRIKLCALFHELGHIDFSRTAALDEVRA